MVDFKAVYSNDDVPWPKGHLETSPKNEEEGVDNKDLEGTELDPTTPTELPSLP